jgi:hypothetical protein
LYLPHGGIQRWTDRRGLLFYARSQAPIKIDADCSGTPITDKT